MAKLTGTVTAGFRDDSDGTGGFGLSMEVDPGVTPFGVTNVRLFPDVSPVILRTNIGSVVESGSRVLEIEREVIQFSGRTASTRFPINILREANDFGSFFDRDGNSLSPSFSVVNGGIQVNEEGEVFGALEVFYQTTYQLLRYTGEIAGTIVSLGAILAFFEGQVNVFQIPVPSFEQDEDDIREIYRRVSEMIVQEGGQFEVPEGWTGAAGSPTFPGGEPNGALPSILVERVHELGYVNLDTNRTFRRDFVIPNAPPFNLTPSFNPVQKLKIATAGNNGLTTQIMQSSQVQNALESAEQRLP